jgi:hypothetical protein
MRNGNSPRSAQEFRLHPLIHTLLEFNLAQNMAASQRFLQVNGLNGLFGVPFGVPLCCQMVSFWAIMAHLVHLRF